MTQLATHPTAEENAAYVLGLVAERGMTEDLAERAQVRFARACLQAMTWDAYYGLAYSDGHNVRHLRCRRLDHYARAYADICERDGHQLGFDRFFAAWDAGETFEGTASEHWYYLEGVAVLTG